MSVGERTTREVGRCAAAPWRHRNRRPLGTERRYVGSVEAAAFWASMRRTLFVERMEVHAATSDLVPSICSVERDTAFILYDCGDTRRAVDISLPCVIR